MATRPSRATAADARNNPNQVLPANLPAAWGTEDIEEFAGRNLTDKAVLIGVPFLIIGAEIERNERRQYDVCYVTALNANGDEIEFSDTSTTGIKVEVQAMLAERGLNPAPGGGFQQMSPRVAVMAGLRVSPFEFLDEESGRKTKAKVYYLTGNGRKKESEK